MSIDFLSYYVRFGLFSAKSLRQLRPQALTPAGQLCTSTDAGTVANRSRRSSTWGIDPFVWRGSDRDDHPHRRALIRIYTRLLLLTLFFKPSDEGEAG